LKFSDQNPKKNKAHKKGQKKADIDTKGREKKKNNANLAK